MGYREQIYYGRAFELATGEIVLPCEFCGNPVWPTVIDSHMCNGLQEALVEEMEKRTDW